MILHKLRNHFVSGLLVLGPLFLTVIFIAYLVKLTDKFVVNPIFQVLPFEIEASFKVFLAKLALALFVLFFVSFIGFIAERFIFKRLFSGWENFLKNIPLFNSIYSSIREVVQAFFGDKKGVFKRVVFLEYPRKGIYVMGFVTQEKSWELHDLTKKTIINIFVPSPPNPATGYFVFVPKEELIESTMTVEQGIRMVISGGAAVPQ
jgi:uncharacterized membrane protein